MCASRFASSLLTSFFFLYFCFSLVISFLPEVMSSYVNLMSFVFFFPYYLPICGIEMIDCLPMQNIFYKKISDFFS